MKNRPRGEYLTEQGRTARRMKTKSRQYLIAPADSEQILAGRRERYYFSLRSRSFCSLGSSNHLFTLDRSSPLLCRQSLLRFHRS